MYKKLKENLELQITVLNRVSGNCQANFLLLLKFSTQ